MIKMLVLDIDGTLTDGKVFFTDTCEFKAFNVKDGMGIHELQKRGVKVVFLTGKQSISNVKRAEQLSVYKLYENISNKLKVLSQLVEEENISFDEVAYAGDDINDLEAIVKCKYRGCPADAVPEIKEVANFISSKIGGDGAIREFIEYLMQEETNE